MNLLRLEIDSDLDQVEHFSAGLRDLFSRQGWDDLLLFQVETALVEAANNIVVHAYRGSAGGSLVLRCWQQQGTLWLELTDRGRALEAPPESGMPEPEAESGRGWPLIHACMDEVTYSSQDGCNRLCMSKRLQ